MSSNQELLRKADLALADLASNGGLLLPEQADTFIRVLIEQPTLLASARVVTMNTPSRKINKIGFGSRIMRVGNSGVALPDDQRVKPDLSQIELNTKEVMAEIHLPYDVLEDNIERGNINTAMGQSAGGLQDTIVQLIAERAALDLEELVVLGDTSNAADPYLALVDGYLKRANQHVVDNAGATISKEMFKMGVKAMPPKYLRDRVNLVQYVSVDNETEYRDTIASRNTALGDATLQGNNQVFAFGSQIAPAPMMPHSVGLFTNPLNLLFGIQRRITIEYDKDIRARTYIIVLSTRVDCNIEETDAVVAYKNIG
jgi:hypothetical protein